MHERIETQTSEEVIKLIQDLFTDEIEYNNFIEYIEQNNEPNKAINLKLQFYNLLNHK